MQGDSIAARNTTDGEMLDPDRVIRGPAAIDIQGSQASVWGTFYQRYTPTGQPSGESRGRYTALLVRQNDGRWLIRHMLTATAR